MRECKDIGRSIANEGKSAEICAIKLCTPTEGIGRTQCGIEKREDRLEEKCRGVLTITPCSLLTSSEDSSLFAVWGLFPIRQDAASGDLWLSVRSQERHHYLDDCPCP